jgi:hypothetical protein
MKYKAMKYKVGDRVKLKRDFEEYKDIYIYEDLNKAFDKLPNGIATIKTIFNTYEMQEIGYYWSEDKIEYLVEPIPIQNRWEILDL